MSNPHRVLCLVPAARAAAVNTFWAANIDTAGAGDRTFTVGLNGSGLFTDAPTYYWCSTSLSDDGLRQAAVRLCQLAGIAAPVGWNGWTKQQRLDWLAVNLPLIFVATGIALLRDDEDGVWSDAVAERTGLGLHTIASPTSPGGVN